MYRYDSAAFSYLLLQYTAASESAEIGFGQPGIPLFVDPRMNPVDVEDYDNGDETARSLSVRSWSSGTD